MQFPFTAVNDLLRKVGALLKYLLLPTVWPPAELVKLERQCPHRLFQSTSPLYRRYLSNNVAARSEAKDGRSQLVHKWGFGFQDGRLVFPNGARGRTTSLEDWQEKMD